MSTTTSDMSNEPRTTRPAPRGGILRSSAIVAAGTGLSRVSGLVRSVLIAGVIGTAALGDAYNIANQTPNTIYDLVLGGVIAATLIPVIVDRFEHDDSRSVDAVASIITFGLIALTVVATVASPLIIRLYTLGKDPAEADQQISLAVPLLIMFMPQVLFYGLSSLWTAMLNARRSFAAPAFAPVLNNVIVVCIFLALRRVADTNAPTLEQVRDDRVLLLLAGLGTTAGIVAMALVLWPAMRRAGIRIHVNLDWRNPAVKAVLRLSGWTFGYVIANAAAFWLMVTLINSTGEGPPSAFTYAWALFQLPYGLFTVSIMTTFMPELSSHANRNDRGAYRDRFGQGLRLSVLVILPAAVAYVMLAQPIVTVLFDRWNFNAQSVDLTSSAIIWLAVGLPGFAVYLYTMRGFYALKDTRTPFFLGITQNAVQVLLSLVLVRFFDFEGVLAAFAIAYSGAALLSLLVLRRRAGGLGGGVVPAVGRHLVAALGMAAVLFVFTRFFDDSGLVPALAETIGGGIVGLAVYVVVLRLLRSEDLTLLRTLRRGGDGTPAPAS
jgi:putative peptidoglycan lipid II flippase